MLTYISLFSGAGVGCYGLKEAGFHCIATVEMLARRLKIQQYNDKCDYASGYICGDMSSKEIKDRVFKELNLWKRDFGITDLDVLIATPPCQGMSVANHKKKDELKRNSLVVESIYMVNEITPKFFIFENVRTFLTSICTDIDGKNKTIKEAISCTLEGKYNILYKIVNFKDYGNPSSRTRTLVIGVRKDLPEITPYDIFPDKQEEHTLRQTIGHLQPLKKMGEISEKDIYHNFKKYSPKMEAWIADIKEGESAFDNADIKKIPHSIKNGVIVYNTNKNGDKYTRQCWDKVPPCIHTRNDIMASQNTVHPTDNRVFSIREVMLMMSVPDSFKWSDIPFDELNALPLNEKEQFLKKEEMNIRQSLGEAVPTIILKQIASKIRKELSYPIVSEADVASIIEKRHLGTLANLTEFINKSKRDFRELAKIAELANAERENNAAYYTRQDICYSVVKNLPDAKGYDKLDILEPSVGVGNFLPVLIQKYSDVKTVNIDVVDIDADSLGILKALINKLHIPNNIHINYINDDFLLHSFDKRYDIIVGNPPYKKLTKEKKLLSIYKSNCNNKTTNNIFSFFIERAIALGDIVSLIVPKSLVNAPEFNITRDMMKEKRLTHIIDFGENGFKGVKIETIAFVMDTGKKPADTIVESYITGNIQTHAQGYLTDKEFPYWLLYRNEEFDKVAHEMTFGIFKAYRDRSITKSITKDKGKIRVLKSRNIGDNTIVDIPGYDSYIDDINNLDVAKHINKTGLVLLPNLTYRPRACFMPKGCITDGSVAILTPVNTHITITKKDLEFYSTETFTRFYAIARNMGTRSLNIDNNSVFFFGKLKNQNHGQNQ